MYGAFRTEEGGTCEITISGVNISETDKDLIFPYDTPVEIEWEETDKIEPIQASSLTVKLISRTDREFVNLYTVEAGSIIGQCYKNGTLWKGNLDPESYEEPYSTADGYETEITFTDFGILQRLKSNFSGIRSLDYIIRSILDSANLDSSRLQYLISTTMPYETTPISLADVYVNTDNFVDEDGEPMTLEEVLVSILQPLGLRIIQKGYYIYVYDLNALYNNGTLRRINWDSTDSVMGVDSVYNDVTLTFSPYSKEEIVNSKIDTDDLPEPTSGNSGTYVYKYNKDSDPNDNPDSFKFII